jgi:hypothetical protein
MLGASGAASQEGASALTLDTIEVGAAAGFLGHGNLAAPRLGYGLKLGSVVGVVGIASGEAEGRLGALTGIGEGHGAIGSPGHNFLVTGVAAVNVGGRCDGRCGG